MRRSFSQGQISHYPVEDLVAWSRSGREDGLARLRSCQEEGNEATRLLEMTTQALVLQGFGGFLIQERLRR